MVAGPSPAEPVLPEDAGSADVSFMDAGEHVTSRRACRGDQVARVRRAAHELRADLDTEAAAWWLLTPRLASALSECLA